MFFCAYLAGFLSGFPVAFAIGGAAVISFGIIAALDSGGLLIHQAIDKSSAEFGALIGQGIKADTVSLFRYPELPRIEVPVFTNGWEVALDRNVSFIVNRINERVLAGQSIETLLAVLMFVLMGITLERSKIANDLLTTMARGFRPTTRRSRRICGRRGRFLGRLNWHRRRDRCHHGAAQLTNHAAQWLLTLSSPPA